MNEEKTQIADGVASKLNAELGMGNIIRCGDCLELLSQLDDNSIDLLITDPPYCIGTTSNGSKATWSDNNLIKPFFDKFFNEIQRVLKHGAEYLHKYRLENLPVFISNNINKTQCEELYCLGL